MNVAGAGAGDVGRRGLRLHRVGFLGRAAGGTLLLAAAARLALGGELRGFARGALGRFAPGGLSGRLFGGGAGLALRFHERGGFARGALGGMALGGVPLGALGGGTGFALGGGSPLALGLGPGGVLARGPFGGGALGRFALGAFDGFAGLALRLGARDALLLGGFGVLAGGALGGDTAGGFELAAGVGVLRGQVVEGPLRGLARGLFGHLTGGALGVGTLGRLADGLLGGLQRDAVGLLALRRLEHGLLGQLACDPVGGFALGGLTGGALGGGPFGGFAGGALLRFLRGPFGGRAVGGFAVGALRGLAGGALRGGAFGGLARGQFGGFSRGPLGGGPLGGFLEGALRRPRFALRHLPRLALGRFAGFGFPLRPLGALGRFPFGALGALRGIAGRALGGGALGGFLLGPRGGLTGEPLGGRTLGRFLLRTLGVDAQLALGLLTGVAFGGLARGALALGLLRRLTLGGRPRVALTRFLLTARVGGLLGRLPVRLFAGPALGAVGGILLEPLPLGGFPRGAQRRFVRLPLGFLPRAPLDRFALGGGARLTLGRGAIRRFPRHLSGGVARHLLRERASFALGLFARLGFQPCAFRRLAREAFTVVDRLRHPDRRVVVDGVRGLLERRDVARRRAHLVLQRLQRVDLVALAAAELRGAGIGRGLRLGDGFGLRLGLGLGLRLGLRLGRLRPWRAASSRPLRQRRQRIRNGAAPRRDRHLHLHRGQRGVDVDAGCRRAALPGRLVDGGLRLRDQLVVAEEEPLHRRCRRRIAIDGDDALEGVLRFLDRGERLRLVDAGGAFEPAAQLGADRPRADARRALLDAEDEPLDLRRVLVVGERPAEKQGERDQANLDDVHLLVEDGAVGGRRGDAELLPQLLAREVHPHQRDAEAMVDDHQPLLRGVDQALRRDAAVGDLARVVQDADRRQQVADDLQGDVDFDGQRELAERLEDGRQAVAIERVVGDDQRLEAGLGAIDARGGGRSERGGS